MAVAVVVVVELHVVTAHFSIGNVGTDRRYGEKEFRMTLRMRIPLSTGQCKNYFF